MARSEESLILLLVEATCVRKSFDSRSEKLHLNATLICSLRLVMKGCRLVWVIVLAGTRAIVIVRIVENHVL